MHCWEMHTILCTRTHNTPGLTRWTKGQVIEASIVEQTTALHNSCRTCVNHSDIETVTRLTTLNYYVCLSTVAAWYSQSLGSELINFYTHLCFPVLKERHIIVNALSLHLPPSMFLHLYRSCSYLWESGQTAQTFCCILH